MGQRVDLLELPDGDLGVDLGRVEFRVAEQLIDEADSLAVLQRIIAKQHAMAA